MRRGTYLLLSIFLSMILMGSQAKSQTDQLLWDTMYRLGVKVDRVVYHHGGRFSHQVSVSQLDQRVQQIAHAFSLSSVTKRTEVDGVRYQAMDRKSNMITKLIVVNDQPNQAWSKPYISIQIAHDGKDFDRSIYQRLVQVLTHYQIHPQIDCSMQGSKPYRQEPLTTFVSQAFLHLQAHEVEAIRTKQVISVSAWSPRISGGLRTQGGQMNLQVATKIDEQTNRLLFTIGSPIITIEY